MGHLVTNQLLTEAECSPCHSYCAGHSSPRVTLWSLWASGTQPTDTGRETRGSLETGCSLLQEEGSRGGWVSPVPSGAPGSRAGGGGGARRTEKGHWGLVSLSPTPGSALEGTRADADSGSWFLPGPPQSSFFSVSRYILGLARGHTNRKHIARLCRPYAAHPEPGAPACCLQSLGCVPWEPKHSSLLPLQLITPPSILHPRPQPGPRAHVTAS